MQICSKYPVRSFLLLFAAVAALTLVACGDDSGGDSGDLGPDPATVTPAAAIAYGELVVKPEGQMRDDLNASVGKLTGDDDPVGMLQSMLDSEFSDPDSDFSYSEDVEPWLGPRVGGFLSDATQESAIGAGVLSTIDTGAAQDAIDKLAESESDVEDASYNGTDYQVDGEGFAIGIVGDFVVAGQEPAFEAAVDAEAGDSLADSPDAEAALADTPDESVFSAYVDSARLVDIVKASGSVDEKALAPYEEQLSQLAGAPVVFSGQAGPDSLAIQFSGPGDGTAVESDGVAALPADAWLALAAPAVGDQIQTGIDQALQGLESGLDGFGNVPGGTQVPDIRNQLEGQTGLDLTKDLAWIGNTSIFVRGSSLLNVGAGLVIETDDEAAARSAIAGLLKAASRQGLTVSKTADGFQLGVEGLPVGAEIAIADGKVVLAGAGATIDDVLNPSETLGDSSAFSGASDALGDLTPAFYLDFETVLSLAESTGQVGGDPGYQAAKPTLDALDYLVAGGNDDGETSNGKIVLGLKEPSSSGGEAAAITP